MLDVTSQICARASRYPTGERVLVEASPADIDRHHRGRARPYFARRGLDENPADGRRGHAAALA
jgi:hypothetical protein